MTLLHVSFKSFMIADTIGCMPQLFNHKVSALHGRQKPSKREGGDLSREVWHNKCLWCKNDKKYKG